MTTRTCRLCCSPVEGRLEFIKASIVCVKCCLLNFRSSNSYQGCFYTVSESEAIEESGCLPSDLDCLNYLSLSHLTDSEPKVQRRYLRGEVWCLRNLRRKEEVIQALGIRLKDIHPLVRHFLLGDYLTKLSESETSLEDVVVYKDVIQSATEIIRHCPRAHPKAALDFCIMYPRAEPREFQEMKNKVKVVFHLEGRRILHGLNKNERQELKDGPLEDIFEAFNAENSRAIIKGYLMKWFSETSADAIMDDKGWREFDWATGPEDRVADELLKFWKEKIHRRDKLMNALKKKGLTLPEASITCEDYMNGIEELTLKEVVAGVDLTERLKKLGYQRSGLKWTAGFRKLFQSLRDLKMGHYQSVRRAVDAAVQAIEDEEESEIDEEEDDEDDD